MMAMTWPNGFTTARRARSRAVEKAADALDAAANRARVANLNADRQRVDLERNLSEIVAGLAAPPK